ncbi:MAG: hypothetical protein ACKO4Z_11235 [Planctomycetota bacterium]
MMIPAGESRRLPALRIAACAVVLAGGVVFADAVAAATGGTSGRDATATLESLLPPRTDGLHDWTAPLEPLHFCGEPRLLPTCVPPAPCHPALPPNPFDLVGRQGAPTCGPIYRGPCEPRTGTHDGGPLPRLHRVHDRMVDWFYAPRTPVHP